MTDKNTAIQEKLRALRADYAAQLPEKLDAIDALWKPLGQGEWDPDTAGELHRAVHSLTGSGTTFGYDRLSEQARSIEHTLKGWLDAGHGPGGEQRMQLRDMLSELRRVTTKTSPETQKPRAAVTAIEAEKTRAEPPPVYVVEDDAALAREIAHQLDNFGYKARVFSSAAPVRAAIANQFPTAVIMDIALPEGPLGGPKTIRDIKAACESHLPVIFISSHDDFQARLEAVRAGGDAYFIKPVDIDGLVHRLDKLTQRKQVQPYRILIVDDDATLAAHYALVLGQAGMAVKTMTEPLNIMEALANDVPELILMDVYMPECTGLELARLIRQQDNYLSVPIVFLSSESDQDKQFGALRMGGDDFLTKPISNDRLVSSIAIRAERSRLLNSLLVQDSLTGLLKHTKIKEQLEIEVSRSKRAQTPFAFAMIDIDHFKSVNDTYGHMSGDRVIKSLSRLLQQRLRQSDALGRYGGEEFAVILPGCDTQSGIRILDEIRLRFAEIRHLHNSREFSVTFSAGIAAFPHYTSAGDLNQAADKALYEAKRRGRNCVVAAGG